ncbi:cell wall hydrolase [Desulfobulbus sp. F4]|nr:cell wall hydrolase [Desulfobulbus sp. F3]MCW5200956.1 cell wall hydrolase [Desulfobulbus sp. F4]
MSFLEGLLWLTLNIYHEARSEPRIGQLAVAHVTLNRASQSNQSLEEVITAPKQFSWTFLQKSYVPDEPEIFMGCMQTAMKAMTSKDFTRGATFYHRHDVRPKWAASKNYVAQYGDHLFYRN